MRFSEGLSLLEFIFFFVKIKTNKIDISSAKTSIRELDLSTHLYQFDTNCGKI